MTEIASGGLFALQVQSLLTYINAYLGSPAVTGPGDLLDPDQQFQYLASTLQIYNPANNLCLDDGGNELLDLTSQGPSAIVSFKDCDSSSINQQFIFTTGNQIINPNWPNPSNCLNGGGMNPNSYQALILWSCIPSLSNQIFNIIPICSPGSSNCL